MLQFWLQKLHKNPGSFFGEGAMDVKLFIAMLLVDHLVSVTAWGHGGGGHAGHSSSGYHSSRGYHSWGGGGGRDDSDDSNDAWINYLLGGLAVGFCVFLLCGMYIHMRSQCLAGGPPHHGYWVVPRIFFIFWGRPYLTTPCAGPEKKHFYLCGDHVAILVNGTYVRAVFSRVEEDVFPPRAEFSFVTDSPARTCEHQRLLEVETGLISRTCLLSAQDMYDGQHCQVAPVEFVGFAPATLEQVLRNIRTPVSPAPVFPEPEQAGGGSGRIA